MRKSRIRKLDRTTTKVCLISYTGQTGVNSRYFPLGVACVSAALKGVGYSVDVIDYDVRSELPNESSLCKDIEQYDVVGFSVKAGTCLAFALDGISWIKANCPEKIIVVGGPLVTAEAERFLEETDVDYIVSGEGERAVVALMDALIAREPDVAQAALSSIPGIGFWREGERFFLPPERIEDVDSLPMPDYSAFDVDAYTRVRLAYTDLGERVITLFTSRGCPFDCQFCTHVFGKKWRGQSARRIFDIVEHLRSTYGINGFMFMDDNFMLSKERVLEFCELVKGKGIRWSCEARAPSVKEDIVRKMMEAGCVSIRMGLESGSDRVLKAMRKGSTLKQNKEAVECLSSLGLPVLAGFMFGVPDESMADAKRTYDFVRFIHRTAKVSKVWAYHYTPRPANPWYFSAVEKGMKPFTLRDWAALDKYSSGVCNMSELSDKQIKRFIARVHVSTFLSNKGKLKMLFRRKSIVMGMKLVARMLFPSRFMRKAQT